MTAPAPVWPKIVLVAVGMLIVAGLVELFRARFATGDVYPAYSSLRSDPLGTRVLFEALGEAGIATGRNFRDTARAAYGRATIYMCGMSWRDFEAASVDDVAALLESVRSGSRLVMAFVPEDPERDRDEPVMDRRGAGDRRGTGADDEKPKVKLSREFGIEARWLPAGEDGQLKAVKIHGDGTFLWHSALSFEPAGDAWRRIYAVGRFAGVMERTYGEGTIVLVGDAYILSNEAMARARQSGLVAWLQGAGRRAVFDENHLGVEENSGVAALARRYGLGHAALALVAVALLYVWKSGASLVPHRTGDGEDGGSLAGRDASSGLVNLLQRHLPERELFSACLTEYRHSTPWRRLAPETQRALDALGVAPGAAGRDPLAAVRAAHEKLKRKT